MTILNGRQAGLEKQAQKSAAETSTEAAPAKKTKKTKS
jgi:hypothetical protein